MKVRTDILKRNTRTTNVMSDFTSVPFDGNVSSFPSNVEATGMEKTLKGKCNHNLATVPWAPDAKSDNVPLKQ